MSQIAEILNYKMPPFILVFLCLDFLSESASLIYKLFWIKKHFN